MRKRKYNFEKNGSVKNICQMMITTGLAHKTHFVCQIIRIFKKYLGYISLWTQTQATNACISFPSHGNFEQKALLPKTIYTLNLHCAAENLPTYLQLTCQINSSFCTILHKVSKILGWTGCMSRLVWSCLILSCPVRYCLLASLYIRFVPCLSTY